MRVRSHAGVVAFVAVSLLSDPSNATPLPVDILVPTTAEVRSMDGRGNNVSNPEWGAANTALKRLVAPAYEDGIADPSGALRPNPRAISNAVSHQSSARPNGARLSNMFWQWGQFLDHDIDLTPAGDESRNISVPTGDPYFDPAWSGDKSIGFNRSHYDSATGEAVPREQMNLITAYIDGSNLYGSDDVHAAALREFSGGRMRTGPGDLLPMAGGMFVAGDERANEQIGLTATHALWLREHNRIADAIAAAHPTLSDETIYQWARSITVAEMQAITYNEWLPLLLGDSAPGAYGGYDAGVNAGIANVFSTAAFRFGHTMLPSELALVGAGLSDMGAVALRDAFFNPELVRTLGIDPILRGLMATLASEIDVMLVDDVRNFLFGPPGAGGFDLAALNLQRGRDHGLPGVNEVRAAFGLDPLTGFDDPRLDPLAAERLALIYDDIDDVDVWIAGLAENPYNGGVLGELVAIVIADQFERLRVGDRFWYENIFSADALAWFNSLRVSDIIGWNTGIDVAPFASAFLVADIDAPPILALFGIAILVLWRLRFSRAGRPYG